MFSPKFSPEFYEQTANYDERGETSNNIIKLFTLGAQARLVLEYD